MFNATDGFVKLKDNTNAIHTIIKAGVFNGVDMIRLAYLSDEYGDGNIRLTYEQNLFILGVKDEQINKLLDILREDPFNDYPPFEKLLGTLKGAYSRRINQQHRLVYMIYKEEKIYFWAPATNL